jgi:hypothetical protein
MKEKAMELDEATGRQLRYWLESHEIDIFLGIEDYDELRDVFEAVIGRQAKDTRK